MYLGSCAFLFFILFFSLLTWVDVYVFIWRLHCCIMKQRVVAFSVRDNNNCLIRILF